MRSRRLIVTFVTVFLLGTLSLNAAAASTPTNADAKRRLAYCGSIPNGSTLTVVATTRLFIFLPKDIYPNLKLDVTSRGATAGAISNAGADGYAQSRDAKPDCWSHYFEFDLSNKGKSRIGRVDISSKSAFKTVPNYLIHFKVVIDPPSATKRLPGNGTVIGHVVLGPVCPVEKIPPDPACAPKPFKSFINVWNLMTGSSYHGVYTDSKGSFILSLSPGNYGLKVETPVPGPSYPRCTQVNVLVVANKTRSVTISCDTGIR